MEDAKSIGPGLNDWGRKATSLLSFGHVSDYLRHGQDSTASDRRPAESAAESVADVAKSEADSQDFFVQQLAAGTRIGFLHQKLAEPRSFDYFEARNKKYTQRLRMPQFLLSETEREAIMTFVLGLVADPPQPKYVYSPDPSTQALWDGSEVLTKYSCRNCHLLETDTWRLTFKPDTIRKRPPATNYPFVEANFDRQQILQSLHADEHGMREAELHGFPALSSDGLSRIYDDEEFPIEEEEDEPFELDRLIYSFDLWRPALIDGQPFQVGQGAIDLQADQIDLRQAAREAR